MITENGLNEIAKGFRNIPTHLVVGSTDIDILPTDVVLSGEFERSVLSSNAVEGGTVKFYGSRLGVVANNDLINGLGLVLSSSLGSSDLLVGNLTSSFLHTTSFDISVEFWLTFHRL